MSPNRKKKLSQEELIDVRRHHLSREMASMETMRESGGGGCLMLAVVLGLLAFQGCFILWHHVMVQEAEERALFDEDDLEWVREETRANDPEAVDLVLSRLAVVQMQIPELPKLEVGKRVSYSVTIDPQFKKQPKAKKDGSTSASIRLTSLVEMSLKSTEGSVTVDPREEIRIGTSSLRPTVWGWDLLPTVPGKGELVLQVSHVLTIEGKEIVRPAFDAIRRQVTISTTTSWNLQRMGSFASTYILLPLLAAAVGLLANYWFKQWEKARLRQKRLDALGYDTAVTHVSPEQMTDFLDGDFVLPALRLDQDLKKRIKHVAYYQTAPVSAITHTASVKTISGTSTQGRFRVEQADVMDLALPVKLKSGGRVKAPNRVRYTKLALIQAAASLDDVFPAAESGRDDDEGD